MAAARALSCVGLTPGVQTEIQSALSKRLRGWRAHAHAETEADAGTIHLLKQSFGQEGIGVVLVVRRGSAFHSQEAVVEGLLHSERWRACRPPEIHLTIRTAQYPRISVHVVDRAETAHIDWEPEVQAQVRVRSRHR
jgi:hypothetical protein